MKLLTLGVSKICSVFCPFVHELMSTAKWWFVSYWFGRSLL